MLLREMYLVFCRRRRRQPVSAAVTLVIIASTKHKYLQQRHVEYQQQPRERHLSKRKRHSVELSRRCKNCGVCEKRPAQKPDNVTQHI